MNKYVQQRIYDFLLQCHRVFYLATSEDDCPYIRPFGAVITHDGYTFFCTGADKRVYRQIKANPKVALCACWKGRRWLRVSGTAAFMESPEAKRKMLELEDNLKEKYGENGDGLVLFAIVDGQAVFSERGADDELLKL